MGVLGDVFLVFGLHVVNQYRLAMIDAPYGELIGIAGAACIGSVAFAVFDGHGVFDRAFAGIDQSHTEDAGIGELIHALIKLEEYRVQVEGGGDLLTDVAEKLDALLLLGDFSGLRADFLRALGDGRFCLLYTSPSPRDGLLSRMPSSA